MSNTSLSSGGGGQLPPMTDINNSVLEENSKLRQELQNKQARIDELERERLVFLKKISIIMHELQDIPVHIPTIQYNSINNNSSHLRLGDNGTVSYGSISRGSGGDQTSTTSVKPSRQQQQQQPPPPPRQQQQQPEVFRLPLPVPLIKAFYIEDSEISPSLNTIFFARSKSGLDEFPVSIKRSIIVDVAAYLYSKNRNIKFICDERDLDKFKASVNGGSLDSSLPSHSYSSEINGSIASNNNNNKCAIPSLSESDPLRRRGSLDEKVTHKNNEDVFIDPIASQRDISEEQIARIVAARLDDEETNREYEKRLEAHNVAEIKRNLIETKKGGGGEITSSSATQSSFSQTSVSLSYSNNISNNTINTSTTTEELSSSRHEANSISATNCDLRNDLITSQEATFNEESSVTSTSTSSSSTLLDDSYVMVRLNYKNSIDSSPSHLQYSRSCGLEKHSAAAAAAESFSDNYRNGNSGSDIILNGDSSDSERREYNEPRSSHTSDLSLNTSSVDREKYVSDLAACGIPVSGELHDSSSTSCRIEHHAEVGKYKDGRCEEAEGANSGAESQSLLTPSDNVYGKNPFDPALWKLELDYIFDACNIDESERPGRIAAIVRALVKSLVIPIDLSPDDPNFMASMESRIISHDEIFNAAI